MKYTRAWVLCGRPPWMSAESEAVVRRCTPSGVRVRPGGGVVLRKTVDLGGAVDRNAPRFPGQVRLGEEQPAARLSELGHDVVIGTRDVGATLAHGWR